ncbi:MAG TPA: YetF domain-containing protein [Vicinamibacterales bacterium]|jgi:uncharacterized membrane protein YcaP (DUF421 family)|nr:YetF domain-containing protein [Vicinamibacterales bacterium]
MDLQELVLTSARAVAVYGLMLGVVRLLGKRTVGNFSAFDLIVALMLGEVVDEIIYGDVQFIQGTVAIVTMAALAGADSWASYRSQRIQAVVEGTPTLIVRDGEFVRKGMRVERLNEQDVLAMLRLQGVRDLREVHLAALETDGELSVLKHDWAEPAQKADISPEYGQKKQRMLNGADEPPPSKRTDAAAGLGQD